MPRFDWQFLLVSIIAICALARLARCFLLSKKRSPGCGSCANTADEHSAKPEHLTIDGKPVRDSADH